MYLYPALSADIVCDLSCMGIHLTINCIKSTILNYLTMIYILMNVLSEVDLP